MSARDELARRIAALPPDKRRLLERRLAAEGLDGARGGDIPRAEPASAYPLTLGQQRLWFIDRLAPGSPAYNIPFAGRLVGRLDVAALEGSLDRLVRRHAVLRSRFTQLDGRAVQQPLAAAELPPLSLRVIDLSALPPAAAEREMEELSIAEGRLPFDLESPPLVRLGLLRMPPPAAAAPGTSDHFLAVTMPHLVTDAWSMGIFFEELPELYAAQLAGREPRLPELAVQVHDVAVWQQRRFAGERLEREMEFWRRQLDGAPTVLELPADRPRPARQSFRGERYAVRLPAPLTGRLEALQRRRGVTPFMLYLAAFGVLLYRLSGRRDLLVGSPVVTREQEATRRLIGFFINVVVLRLDLRSGDGEPPGFTAFLERVKRTCLESFAHQEVPFERLVETFWRQRTLTRTPLVQVTFVLQNVGITRPDFEGLELTHFRQTGTRTARDDLTLGFWEGNEAMAGWFEYPTDLFDRSTIVRFSGYLERLLEAIADDPERAVGELPMLGDGERQQLLVEWSGEALELAPATLDELVARQAERRPQAAALLLDDGAAVSYRRLLAAARRFARALAGAGVGPETPVPIALDPSPELVVALLGALLARGFYVPLDPADPPARRGALLARLWERGAPRVVVAAPGLDLGLAGPSGERLVSEPRRIAPPRLGGGDEEADVEEARGGEREEPPRAAASDLGLAYLLFTSGTSGEPKGVAVPHRAVHRLLAGLERPRRVVRLGPGEVHLQLAPPAFDASTFEIWGALATGGTLAFAGGDRRAPAAIARAVERSGASTLWLTAGLFHLVAEHAPAALAAVPQLLAGGDVLAAPALRRALERSRGAIVDGYGPTEGTTFTTCRRFEPGDEVPERVPIGRPIGGTRVVVADPRAPDRPRPIGVAGELLIGGEGLARGYLGRPRDTAERFRPDPFGPPGARLYASGDRARWLAGGELDFLGRLDRQLKVRGHRVEPAEIEAALAALPAVDAAAVAPRPSPGGEGQQLVAYVVAEPRAEARELEPETLRAALAETLPAALLPARFVRLESLPLTANGKLDRAALPAPAAAQSAGDGAPRDATEAELVRIWGELLGVDGVGVHDDFFALGGDSILSIQALARAAEAGIELEAQAVFTHPTIAELAPLARRAPAAAEQRPEPPGPVPLTPTQRWFFDLALERPEHWNLAFWVRPAERLGRRALEHAAERLVERHDALRLGFARDASGVRQRLDAAAAAPRVETLDLAALGAAAATAELERAAERAQRGFDLGDRGASSLLRLLVAELPPGVERGRDEGGQRLLLVVHHLVADTVSCALLLEELLALAHDPRAVLPAPTAPYSRRARAEQEPPAPEPLPAGDRLPLDDPRGDARELATRHIERVFAPELTDDLYRRAGEAYGTRSDELLLTALAQAAAETWGHGRLPLCIEGHGRDDEELDLSRTVGWLTRLERRTLDLGAAEDELGGALTAIKEALRGAAPAPPPAAGDLCLAFNHLGRLDRLLAAGGAEAADLPLGALHDPHGARPFPLELLLFARGGALYALWSHDGRIAPRTARTLADAFERRVEALVGHCLDPVAGRFTPSDFPQLEISQTALDRIASRFAEPGEDGEP